MKNANTIGGMIVRVAAAVVSPHLIPAVSPLNNWANIGKVGAFLDVRKKARRKSFQDRRNE
jgi:hypothetical protein